MLFGLAKCGDKRFQIPPTAISTTVGSKLSPETHRADDHCGDGCIAEIEILRGSHRLGQAATPADAEVNSGLIVLGVARFAALFAELDDTEYLAAA